jgi:DNA polymerase III subunit delta'
MPLNDLLGHRELFERLVRELERGRSQGYLFWGPKGVGKELVAEGLVLALFCERSGGLDFCCTPDRCPNRADPIGAKRVAKLPQCDCCAACVQVATRMHPDFDYVALLPKRSFVLIEQVRELIAHLGIKPARARARAAIIDDAETLNLPAQNALLKTLEEPPGYAVIFLIAENANALLDTVRSRLRPVHFPILPAAALTELLERKAELDPERAEALALLARGSASRAMALAAQEEEPPARELLDALKQSGKMDFVQARRVADRFFATREQAQENFELMARLLEEALYLKLAGAAAESHQAPSAAHLSDLVDAWSVQSILVMLELALKAAGAVDEMANPRLQAEGLWVAAGEALRSAKAEPGKV